MKKKYTLLLLFIIQFTHAQDCTLGVTPVSFSSGGGITLSDSDAINIQTTRNRTIEFNFKASNINTRQFLYEEGANVNAIQFYLYQGRVYCGGYRSNASNSSNRRVFRSGSGIIMTNTWFHIALTIKDTSSPDITFKWYLNGVLQDTKSGFTIDSHSGNVGIGANNDSQRYPTTFSSSSSSWVNSSTGTGTPESYTNSFTSAFGTIYPYTGDLALLRIWNTARSTSEINTNKNTYLTHNDVVSSEKLVGYQNGASIVYKTHGSSGGSLTDSNAVVDTPSETKWDGSASTSWTNNGNWTPSGAPNNALKESLRIENKSNDPIINSGEVTIGYLTIDSGAELTIKSGSTLNVAYGVKNSGTITVEEGGSFLCKPCEDTEDVVEVVGSGKFDVQRTRSYAQTKLFSYWSSPIEGGGDAISTVWSGFPNVHSYLYDASITNADWAAHSGDMQSGVGYAIRTDDASADVEFSGKVNQGDIPVAIYNNTNIISVDPNDPLNEWSVAGDNLIGNPYPSAINWDTMYASADVSAKVEGTIYLWDQQTVGVGENDASDYITYNSMGSVPSGSFDGNIGIAQGFFVRSILTGAQTLTFKNDYRIAGNNTLFLRTENENDDPKLNRIWLNLESDTQKNQFLIGFLEDANVGYDEKYDGFYNDAATLDFYSIQGVNNFTIQGLPSLTTEQKVAIGFKNESTGNFTIAIEKETISSDYFIFLEDKETGVITDLRTSDYTFSLNTLEENITRFQLLFSKTNVLSVNESVLDSPNLLAFVNTNRELEIAISNSKFPIKKIQILDIQGKTIKQYSYSEKTPIKNLAKGIYIVKAILQNNQKLTRKIAIF